VWCLNVLSSKSLIIFFIYIFTVSFICFSCCIRELSINILICIFFKLLLFFFIFFNIFVRFNFFQSILYSCYIIIFVSGFIPFFNLFKIVFQTRRLLIFFQYGSFFHIYRKIFKWWCKSLIYRCSYHKDLIPCFFFYIYLLYKSEHSFKKEIVGSFGSQVKYIVIIDVAYPYYIIISNVIKFEVKVVFFVWIFFIVVLYRTEVDIYYNKFFIFSFKC